MRQQLKKRKIEPSFKGVVQLDWPLWDDVFSVICLYLPDSVLNCLLRSSKRFLEIVKQRAIFSQLRWVSTEDESSLQKLGTFFFSSLSVKGDINTIGERFLRQRFLKFGKAEDFRILCQRDTRGNLLFPQLKKISLFDQPSSTKEQSVSVSRLCEFLREYPFPISFDFVDLGLRLDSSLPKHLLEKIIKVGKFKSVGLTEDIFPRQQSGTDMYYTEEDLCILSNLDTQGAAFDFYFDYTQRSFSILEALAKNPRMKELVLVCDDVFREPDFLQLHNLLVKPENFVKVKRLRLRCIGFYNKELTMRICELSQLKPTLESVVIRLIDVQITSDEIGHFTSTLLVTTTKSQSCLLSKKVELCFPKPDNCDGFVLMNTEMDKVFRFCNNPRDSNEIICRMIPRE